MAALACVIWTSAALGQAEPVEAAPPDELFAVRAVEVVGDEAEVLPRQRLLSRTIHLVEADGHYRLPAEGEEARRVRLDELGELGEGDEPVRVTADVLRAAANAVFEAYSEARIAAVRVSVPEQTIPRLTEPDGDGVLAIAVEVGRLGQVRVRRWDTDQPDAEPEARDDHWYGRAASASPVGADDPVRLSDIDRHVHWLNRHPGRRVEPLLTPDPSGELNLDYLVTEARPWTAYFQTSNTGTENTSDWRQRFGFLHNNLTSADDILTLEYTTARFDEVHAFRGSYERPLPGLERTSARVFGSWSRFRASDVGLAGLDFRSEHARVGGELIQNVFQHEDFFIDLAGGVRFEHSETDNRTLNTRGSTDFLLPFVSLRGDRLRDEMRTSGSVSLEGNIPGAVGTDEQELQALGRTAADRSWVSLRADATQSFFLEPLLQPNWGEPETGSTRAHEVAFTFYGQFVPGDRRLAPPFTQTMGGFRSVRGYPQNYTAADNAIIGTAEYRLHLPHLFEPGEPLEVFGQRFRHRPERQLGRADWNLILRAFVDAGRTIHNDRRAFESNVTMVGSGVGAELRLRHNITARADWGFALLDADNGSREVTAGSSQVHLIFTVAY